MNFKQTVKLTYVEGGLYSLMVASTESFLFYYAVKQNVTSLELAFLATLPLALGAFSQMLIPKLIPDKHLGGSVVWTMLLQIIGVIGILHTVAVDYSFNKILFYACIHHLGGLTSIPLWIDWASKIIPKRNFRKYMAQRSSFTWYLMLFFYLSFALLSHYASWFKLVHIFFIGALARLLSCALQIFIIRGDYNSKIKKDITHRSSQMENTNSYQIPADILKIIWVFIIWTSIFRLAAYVSAPFFVSYMTNDLNLSMSQYVVLSSIPYFGRAVFFNLWGRAGKDYGAFYGVQLAALGISIIPMIWMMTRTFSFLVMTEIISGICWGGFELNQVLMIQNFIHPSMKEGSRVLLGLHMALTNFLGVIGAIFGSYLLDAHWSFMKIFLLSSILRFLSALILIIKASKFKKAEINFDHFKIYLRNLFIRF